MSEDTLGSACQVSKPGLTLTAGKQTQAPGIEYAGILVVLLGAEGWRAQSKAEGTMGSLFCSGD